DLAVANANSDNVSILLGVAVYQTTSLTLTSSASPSTFGRPVTLTAAITPSNITGQVTFYDGVTLLGSATLSSGQGSLVTRLLPAGRRSLKAFYPGDLTNLPSTSATITQQVASLPQNGFQTAVNYTAGSQVNFLAAGDLNGDGKTDLVAVN